MTERVLNLVTYIQWEKPQVIEYDKICNGLKALSEILSIYSYIINMHICNVGPMAYVTRIKFVIVIVIVIVISVNIVPRWDIYGRSQARVFRYPNSGQYSPISVQ